MLRRGHKLYYRHSVPVDAQRLLNRVEVWRSLRTDSLAVAVRRLPSVIARIEMEIEHARAVAGLPVDPTLIRPLNDDPSVRSLVIAPSPPTSTQPDDALTLGEAYRSYIDDPTRAWSANTREAYETSRKLAIAVIGEETPVASVSRTHCRDLLDVLRFLPANAGKLFPKLSPREAAERARLRGDVKIISAANANSLMSNMSSFLNWAVNEELLARNPARGLRLTAWTKPLTGDVRFALYNGLMGTARKSNRDKAEHDVPHQVLYRETLRANPPPILVTNQTMLEYMTIRREDRKILDASRGKLRWIVIDEAHSYIGSAAAELSLLLRRAMNAFDVTPDQVRFVATSATIGSADDAGAVASLQRFLSDIAGVPLERTHVVIGKPQPVDLSKVLTASDDPAARVVAEMLEKKPQTISSLSSVSTSAEKILLDLSAHNAKEIKPVLPMRAHSFRRCHAFCSSSVQQYSASALSQATSSVRRRCPFSTCFKRPMMRP